MLNLLKYADDFPQMKLYLLANSSFCDLLKSRNVKVIKPRLNMDNIAIRTLWERHRLPRVLEQLKADVLFCPGGIINTDVPAGCLEVVAFRNMLILDERNRRKFPPGYMRCRLALLKRASIRSFRQADLVITLTHYAKAKLDEKIPDRKGASIVIHHGLDDTFRLNGGNLRRCKYLPAEDYLLYVSLMDAYKAHLEVVRAFDLLCRQRPTREKLLFVGPDQTPYGQRVRKEIRRSGLEDRIFVIGQLPHLDMPSVYHHATAHIFASTCENCPNIVIESLASGRPLFLSNRPPMPELAGDAAVYFDPDKPRELAALLLKHLDDERWTEEMGRRAYERSFRYDWETTARRTFETILQLKSGGVT